MSQPGSGSGPRPGTAPRQDTGRLAVEVVIQPAGSTSGGLAPPLIRSAHRVTPGTTIRALLVTIGPAAVIEDVAAGLAGLARYGRRAWLDDVLVAGDRVEVTRPIVADAKAARQARAAAARRGR